MNDFKNLDNERMADHRIVSATIMPLTGDQGLDTLIDEKKLKLDALPLLPLRDAILFEGMAMPIPVGRQKSLTLVKAANKNKQYIGVIAQRNNEENPTASDLYEVGIVAEILKIVEMPDGTRTVFVQGKQRFKLDDIVQTEPYFMGEVHLLEKEVARPKKRQFEALMTNIRQDIQELSELPESSVPNEIQFAMDNINDPDYLVVFLCSACNMSLEQRQHLLEMNSMFDRAFAVASIISTELEYAKIRNNLHRQTQSEISNIQRQHYLRTQIQSIQHELGETGQEDIDALLAKANLKQWPAKVQETFRKEINKLQRMNEQSPDYYIQYNYLQTMVDLPWGKTTRDNLNLKQARKVLDNDHYGLDKIKDRILEHLAVLKMRGDMKAPILCLVGPPGVGKTSLGKSIATALKREYVRVSFGGLHDEAEIRGHRRTYIGALPGRIISGIQRAGTDNPVFVLDEIDKISSDFKGDPSSALLEVLDPEQNSTFHDNFLDVDYDLSQVLFIATANSMQTIAAPLRDRMEIINLSGYIIEEKVEIAERHLLPHQKKEHGLDDIQFSIPKKTMEQIVDQYTRESGVRLLDKQIAKIMRRVAWKAANNQDIPTKLSVPELEEYLGKPEYNPEKYDGNDYAGVVTGLAWTSVGGVILEVESTLVKGKGGLTLTGNLGDVMKESAQLALQWIKSNADELEIPAEMFEQYTAHIHCPEGATPKDGPSAGITMVTSLVSTFTQRRVRARIAMTGEITLRGKVIPIGGVKEKILAAKRAGITDLVLCIDNKKDVEEINELYTRGLNFHYVRDLHELLDYALLKEKVKGAKEFKLKS